ncbi:unnamed protein product [Acanthoscelides obtectus]|uniref:Mediator of DNA damage checkpoint protein 1 n=1 Tax=Acanthoscelides obtectus TaxID=200917 RepID=A0A9P0L1K9_ACAOB|nr:unnamed protein product [Acanthoscelides obtectus]CAK1637795.1 Mediator of DNA damage checkpoint protein 1 [Acanthoscelides obtectus]
MKMEANSRIQVAVLKVHSKEFPLYKGLNVIGRNKAATVNIVNLNVSQNHAVIIEVDEIQHYISDMNSSNGTLLHGTKLKPLQLYELNDYSNIAIGNVHAKYCKLPQPIVVSNSSMQILNNTQMSQSMYACNTQLMIDETVSDSNTQSERQPHSLRLVPPPPKFAHEHTHIKRTESQLLDIHDVATQVVTYPERRSPLPPVVEQCADLDIHDEATQVVALPDIIERNDKDDIIENKEQQNQNNADHPTSEGDSEATDIGSQGSVQQPIVVQRVFHNRHSYHYSQEPSTSTANRQVDDSFQGVSHKSDSNVVVEESFDAISRVSDDLLADAIEFPTDELETTIQEGDIPEAIEKPLSRQKLAFDSPQPEETNNKVSRSSRKLESDGTNEIENDSQSTEDIVVFKKKPLRKLESTQESDSDTDIECSPVIGDTQAIKPVSISKKAVIDSDSDTDIENKENIKNCSNTNNIKDKPCGSDSDTDIEDKETVTAKEDNQKKTTADSSEDAIKGNKSSITPDSTIPKSTDKEKETSSTVNHTTSATNVDLVKQQSAQSDSDTDVEDCNQKDVARKSAEDSIRISDKLQNRNASLNDSDCIPATQDAFALAFNYDQKNDKVNTDCSEESFKLGLTELMEGSQNSQPSRKSNGKNSEELSKKDDILEGLRKSDQTSAEELSKEDSSPAKKVGKLEDEQKTEQMNIEENAEPGPQKPDDEAQEDEVYLMPTQKLDIPNTSAEDKQFKIPSQKFTFKKKTLQLEQSITTMFSTQTDDMYMMPTQKLNEDGTANGDDDDEDDVFFAATQVVDKCETKKKDDDNDDIYIAATQIVENRETKNKDNDVNDDVYIAATQVVEKHETKEAGDDNVYILPTQRLTEHENNEIVNNILAENRSETRKSIVENVGRTGDVDAYDVPTQVLETDAKHSKESKLKDNDLYDAPTQVLQKPDDSSKELGEIERKDSKNSITLSQFENFAQSTADSLKQNNVILEETRPETLSQIETSIKQPLNAGDEAEGKPAFKNENSASKTKSTRRLHSRESLDKTNYLSLPRESIDQEAAMSSAEMIRKDIIKTMESIATKERSTSSRSGRRKKSPAPEMKEKTVSARTAARMNKKEKSHLNEVTERKDEIKDEGIEPKSNGITEESKTLSKKTCEGESTRNKKLKAIEDETKSTDSVINATNRRKIKSSCDSETTSGDRETKTSNIRSTRRRNSEAREESTLSGRTKERGARLVSRESDIEKQATESASSRPRRDEPVADDDEKSKAKPVASTRSRRGDSQEPNTKEKSAESNRSARSRSREPSTVETTTEKASSRPKKGKSIANDVEKVGRNMEASTRSRRGDSCEPRDESVESTKRKGRPRKDKSVADDKNMDTTAVASKRITRKNSSDIEQAKSSRKRRGSSSDSIEETVVEKNARSTRKRDKIVSDLETISENDNNNVKSKPSEDAVVPSVSGKKKQNDDGDDEVRDFEISKPTKARNTKRPADVASTSSSPCSAKKSKMDMDHSLSTPEKNRRRQKPKVVFTMLDSPQLESFVKHLGGSIVDKVDASNVLVTEHVKRSMKLLSAVGLAKPICSIEWIKASKKAHEFLDPWDYILVDKDAESKWKFSLKESLERASKKKLFENYVFQIMTTNAADVLKGAIQCCGGKCVSKKPPGDGTNFVVVASPDQRNRFKKIYEQAPKALVIEPEAIFDGVLRQEVRFSRHLLT